MQNGPDQDSRNHRLLVDDGQAQHFLPATRANSSTLPVPGHRQKPKIADQLNVANAVLRSRLHMKLMREGAVILIPLLRHGAVFGVKTTVRAHGHRRLNCAFQQNSWNQICY